MNIYNLIEKTWLTPTINYFEISFLKKESSCLHTIHQLFRVCYMSQLLNGQLAELLTVLY